MNIKNIAGTVAIILTFLGYVPYLRDIINGKTKPHIYSWFLWGLVTLITFAIQISGKAGPGAFVTLTAAIMCIIVFILGLFTKGKKDIKLVDTLFLLLAFSALVIWLLAKQPVLSMVLTTTIDLLGFAPTIRKSWNKPYTETLSFYHINTFRFALAVAALQRYTIITALYPITWFFANGLFDMMLLIRRKQVSQPKE